MEVFHLKGSAKEQVGRRSARRMRREGRVPAIIYGNGENVMCTVSERDLTGLLITPSVYLVALDVDGTVHTVVLREVQYHPVSERPLHLDFYRYREDQPIEISIPVRLFGHAAGVRAGGRLATGLRRIRVVGLPADLPDDLPIDVTKMKLGEVLLVSDLKFDKLTIAETPNLVVAMVKSQRGARMGAVEQVDSDVADDAGEGAGEAGAAQAGEES